MELNMQLSALLSTIGEEVEDAEQESFLAFSQPFASQNLGFVNSRSNTVEVSIHEREFTVHQSPTVLASRRAGGTTGAVLWKITPLLAEWLCAKENILWTSSFLNRESTAVELGCGVAGLLALSLAPYLGQYIATDQEYVRKVFKENLAANSTAPAAAAGNNSTKAKPGNGNKQRRRQQQQQPQKKHNHSNNNNSKSTEQSTSNITFVPLDWEVDSPCMLKESGLSNNNNDIPTNRQQQQEEEKNNETATDRGFDLLLGCDCIYNDALIYPFTRTCADICRLRPGLVEPESGSESGTSSLTRPTLCIIAQNLRAHEVFENWLREALVDFHVWRIKDGVLGREMSAGSGFVVHALVLRGE